MSLLRSTFFLISAEVVFAISGYLIQAGLGRILEPENYGRYSLVIGFTTMIIILIGRGIPTAMAKRISEHATDTRIIHAIKTTAMRWQYSIIAGATILFYACIPLIARSFGDITLIPLFKIATLIIPAFALSSFHVLYFNGLKRFGVMTTLKMTRGIFRLAWIVGLAYLYHTNGAIIGAIMAPLSVFLIALIIDITLARKESFHQHHNTNPSTYPIGKLLTFAGGFMAFLLLYEFFVRADIYMVKILIGDDASVGIYNAAMTVALIPYYLLYALALVLFPTISTVTTKGDHYARQLLSTILRLLLIVITPIGFLMAIFAQPLIQILFGSAFASSANLVPLMIGGTIFGTIFYICAAVFNGANHTRIPVIILTIAIVGSIGANILLVPYYGITATAIIFSSTSIFMGIASMYALKKIFHTTISIYTIMRIIISLSVISFLAHIVPQTLFGMLFGGTGLLATYILLLIGMRELRYHEIQSLLKQ